MVRVKICGVTKPEHAIAAAEAGADYIGLNFARESRRFVTLDQAKEIIAALRSSSGQATPALVGVFVNEDPAVIQTTVDALGLDLVQLSGDEPWEAVRTLPRPALKAYR